MTFLFFIFLFFTSSFSLVLLEKLFIDLAWGFIWVLKIFQNWNWKEKKGFTLAHSFLGLLS